MKISSIALRQTASIAILAGLLAVTANAAALTWDFDGNFNAPGNPNASTAFSYGNGNTPGGFAADSNITVNCLGGTSYCVDNGVNFPGYSGVIWNGTGSPYTSGTVTLSTTDVSLGPQSGPGVILRFTASTAGVYSISGIFDTLDVSHHPTDASVFEDSTQLFSATVGGPGSTVPFSLTGLTLTVGDTLDVIVTSPGGDCCFLTTGLSGTITETTQGLSGTPEPATWAMLLTGLAGLVARRKRR